MDETFNWLTVRVEIVIRQKGASIELSLLCNEFTKRSSLWRHKEAEPE